MNDNHILYDIAVIGGGINGAGIAADAAGRGLSVFLCEKDDWASHTSSASSKLIHGGLRYLEHKEFRLVREALAEREVLLKKAPHIIHPMRFIMPHQPHLRPAWLIRTGLFFYDHLGKRETLAGSNLVDFQAVNSPLKAEITRGFEYSDCAVDDARLVVLNVMQARELGAKAVTRTRCLGAKRVQLNTLQNIWQIELEKEQGAYQIQAKVLVNAAGPWVAEFIQQDLHLNAPYGIRLIQGSHLIVPKLYDGQKAYILQNDDQRIVFAIPYLNKYTLIGTTDKEYLGDPNRVEITDEEIAYLLDASNDHFKTQLSRKDIISTFSGVRPLCDDESDNPSAVTRDYTLALSQENDGAPLLSVFGGKLTTYRKLAESAMGHVQAFFPEMKKMWTASSVLPGAENFSSAEDLAAQIQDKVSGVSAELAARWVNAYGTRIWKFIQQAASVHELGQDFGHGLYAQEVDYLVECEWAVSAEDILKRRTKLYLEFSADESLQLDQYLQALHQRRAQEDAA
ncbi:MULTISPECIES: glycerol-3-phosphate dehydrogenase [Acinetobacter]|uniref:Glycerol-3-phosphate dehydrogenase n=2 Tax=Acinetobacter TaxID=469 RepID=A0A4Q7AYB6_9GAMM|nr:MULTISPECIES: glycerol-3-phosphate dehydrogenase [Acinetobacter]MCW8037800.1 glycerol-3-phosphate dehydrogenase [Acinetobacter entericus]RZG68696.1 glycerol-3-phosphate dehydrogenase [Acinetobacter bouvetii]TCB75638.1 glycerol-3-phosphate dehydrogenase [Acinetobacter sp. ANC 4177]